MGDAESTGNTAVLVGAIDAWNRGDLEAFKAACHPELECHLAGLFPGLEPIYRGPEGMADLWRSFREAWKSLHIEIEEIKDEAGGRLAATARLRGTGAHSGVEVDMAVAYAARVRDGLLFDLVTTPTVAEARAQLDGALRGRAV